MIKNKTYVKANDIAKEIREVRHQIKIAENRFDNATEPRLINSYIFEINSLNERYSYLIEKSR